MSGKQELVWGITQCVLWLRNRVSILVFKSYLTRRSEVSILKYCSPPGWCSKGSGRSWGITTNSTVWWFHDSTRESRLSCIVCPESMAGGTQHSPASTEHRMIQCVWNSHCPWNAVLSHGILVHLFGKHDNGYLILQLLAPTQLTPKPVIWQVRCCLWNSYLTSRVKITLQPIYTASDTYILAVYSQISMNMTGVIPQNTCFLLNNKDLILCSREMIQVSVFPESQVCSLWADVHGRSVSVSLCFFTHTGKMFRRHCHSTWSTQQPPLLYKYIYSFIWISNNFSLILIY